MLTKMAFPACNLKFKSIIFHKNQPYSDSNSHSDCLPPYSNVGRNCPRKSLAWACIYKAQCSLMDMFEPQRSLLFIQLLVFSACCSESITCEGSRMWTLGKGEGSIMNVNIHTVDACIWCPFENIVFEFPLKEPRQIVLPQKTYVMVFSKVYSTVKVCCQLCDIHIWAFCAAIPARSLELWERTNFVVILAPLIRYRCYISNNACSLDPPLGRVCLYEAFSPNLVIPPYDEWPSWTLKHLTARWYVTPSVQYELHNLVYNCIIYNTVNKI